MIAGDGGRGAVGEALAARRDTALRRAWRRGCVPYYQHTGNDAPYDQHTGNDVPFRQYMGNGTMGENVSRAEGMRKR